MDETFYGVLGVEPDADEDAVHRAYREVVKARHPDVSDDPDARERFRRVKTARDVLVDAAERDRYDRLGHDRYVRRHVDGAAWGDHRPDVGDRSDTMPTWTASAHVSSHESATDRGGGEETASEDGRARGTATEAGGAKRGYGFGTARDVASDAGDYAAGDYATGSRSRASGYGTGAGPSPTGMVGGLGSPFYHSRPERGPAPTGVSFGGLRAMLDAVGVWLLVDSLLMILSIWTAWLVLVWQSLSAASIVVATVLLVVTLASTALHLTIQAYA